jgi:D-psicose/D-tagatose/L-ribulose 3-epimerase
MSLDVSFGASTWLWTSPFSTASAEELFPKIAAMGFDAVEIAVEDPSLIDGRAVASALSKHGLKAIVCGAFGPDRDLTHDDPAVHRACLDYIRDCLDLCVDLNAGFVGGPMYSAVGKARMVPPEQRRREWELAVINLRIACDLAAERGKLIGIEPLNRFESDLVNTSSDAVRMINDIGHPAARIVLDGFHMNIEERNIFDAITAAGDRLVHLQVSENYRGTPGTGQTRWDEYRRGLEAIGYRGCVSIESFTTDNQSLAGAVCFWRPMAESQDAFASQGIAFLRQWASE